MDNNCVICLTFNADIFSRINYESSEWKECNIKRIIEKHLWWWFLKQSPSNTAWICRQCWRELSSFHNFYLKVEQVHKQYELLNWSSINGSNLVDVGNTKELLIVKEELMDMDSCMTTSTEDLLVPLAKYQKRKYQQSAEKAENMQINELPPVIVKNENDFSITDDVHKSPKPEYITDETSDYMDNESVDISEPNASIEQSDNDEEYRNCKSTKEKTKTRKRKSRNSKTKSKCIDYLTKAKITQKNDEYLAQSDYKLYCHLCKIPLTDFLNLKTHFRNEHEISGYALCCNKKFYNRGVLTDHLKVHEDPNYFKCPHCEKILSHRMSFENHLDFHKQSSETRERIFSCDKCDKSFFKKAVYDRHILSHVPDDERKYKCDECEKKFAAEYLVTQHKASAHENKYGKICDVCGKSFRERFSFMRHMDEHNGAPPSKLPCDICGVELASKYLLNRHKKHRHTEENQQEQICPYCSKVSPNIQAHRQHISYAHTLEPKHACHMCDKKFKRPLKLKEHLSTHTGEPLYTCLYCPRTFISSANMHKHHKVLHPEEWKEAKLKKLPTQKLRDM